MGLDRPRLSHLFDSSVLSAFCLAGRLDLLAARYAGRAGWVVDVQDEILRGVAREPRLGEAMAARWLGEPLSSFDVDEIERTRLALGGTGRDRRHLGEAASIVVARRNGLVLAIDDRDATRLARARGVRAIGTIAILRAVLRTGGIDLDDALDLVSEMREVHGRRLPQVTAEDLRP